MCIYIRRPLPTAGGARQRRNYQQQGPRSHYKQQGQEARKHWSKKQDAITGNKRQEARNKKPGSNKRLEDRSEKQETTSQEATSGWKTGQRASFLVDSESNVRHCGRWPAGPVRPSGPCIGVASASCVSRGGVSRGGWKTGPMAAVARRPGPSLRTLLFWRGNRAVCELWRLEDRSDSKLSCRFRKQG